MKKNTRFNSCFIKLLVLALIAIFGLIIDARAQQQNTFTQYMFNPIAINPAYAGYSGGGESLEINALARQQWVGMKGAPSTQTLSAHAPLRTTNMGLGMQISHDKIGVSREVSSYFSYAYHLPLSKRHFNGKFFSGGSALSFGLQAGVNYFRNDLSSLFLEAGNSTGNDPSFTANNINKLFFNFGAGVFFYTEKMYLGFSVPYILNNRYGSGSQQSRHMFLTAGYLFDLTPSLKFKPSVLVKHVQGAPVQVDVNANVLVKNLIWLGVSWRSLASVGVLAEYHVSNRVRIGYAYEIATSSLALTNSGTHEFRLNYRIPLGDIKIINPRCF